MPSSQKPQQGQGSRTKAGTLCRRHGTLLKGMGSVRGTGCKFERANVLSLCARERRLISADRAPRIRASTLGICTCSVPTRSHQPCKPDSRRHAWSTPHLPRKRNFSRMHCVSSRLCIQELRNFRSIACRCLGFDCGLNGRR
jgi:hypothetical protein